MKNTFNYTGRKRILREHVRVGIHRPSQLPEARIEVLELADLNLPADAMVFMEIDTGRVGLTRYSLGTVDDADLDQSLPLSEMDLSDVSFRVKVVGSTGNSKGRLLADVDHLRPEDRGSVSSLLEVKPSDNLGQRIWRLDISEEVPQLMINANLPDWRDFGRSPTFQALVFPQAIYEICNWLRKFDEYAEGTIEGRWRELLKSVGYDPNERDREEDAGPEDFDNEWSEWSHQVADAFSRNHRTLEMVLRGLEGASA